MFYAKLADRLSGQELSDWLGAPSAPKTENDSDAPGPRRAHEGDAGFDLRYCPGDGQEGSLRLQPRQIVTVGTGVHVAIPKGWMGEIRPRSGMASKGLVAILGTVDSGYRGELKVTLHYIGGESSFEVEPGQRIAQLVFTPIYSGEVMEVKELPDSLDGRDDRGFGSTGID